MRCFPILFLSVTLLVASHGLAQRQSFLEADTISVDNATGDVSAQGNVVIVYEDQHVSGDQLNWIKSEQRMMVNGNDVFTHKAGTRSLALSLIHI